MFGSAIQLSGHMADLSPGRFAMQGAPSRGTEVAKGTVVSGLDTRHCDFVYL